MLHTGTLAHADPPHGREFLRRPGSCMGVNERRQKPSILQTYHELLPTRTGAAVPCTAPSGEHLTSQTRPNRLHTHANSPKRLAHPRLSVLHARAAHAHPLHPAALAASVSCGEVLVRVPVSATCHNWSTRLGRRRRVCGPAARSGDSDPNSSAKPDVLRDSGLCRKQLAGTADKEPKKLCTTRGSTMPHATDLQRAFLFVFALRAIKVPAPQKGAALGKVPSLLR